MSEELTNADLRRALDVAMLENDNHQAVNARLVRELVYARAVIKRYREEPCYVDDCDPGENDPYYQWQADMLTLCAAYDAAREESRGDDNDCNI